MTMTWGWTGKSIAEIQDIQAQVGPGWSDLIARLIKDLEQLSWDGTILQVKEKFGGLRFYIGSATDEIFDRIMQAEHESYKICEVCGQLGRLYHGGWWKTLCKLHAQEQGYTEEEIPEF